MEVISKVKFQLSLLPQDCLCLVFLIREMSSSKHTGTGIQGDNTGDTQVKLYSPTHLASTCSIQNSY